MKRQEKKYRVDSFAKIQKILDETGAKKGKKVKSTHYYAKQKGNDVVKLVEYSDRNEIHILEESSGKYSLKESFPVESTEAGLQWLKEKGYKTINPVKMAYTDYEYKDGIVGLYLIDDFLNSVILDFPEEQLEEIEKEMGLDAAEVIDVPYSRYLDRIGRISLTELK